MPSHDEATSCDRSLVFGQMYVWWPNRSSCSRGIWSELSPTSPAYSACGSDAPGLDGPKCPPDYAGHTNQDYETAERICGEKGITCRNEEADKLRDARLARELARKLPCEGITANDMRDIETRFPRTIGGVPAMPVAVSNPYVSSVNGEPTCAAEMIVTFNGDVGYNYVFLIERRPDRLHLEPVAGLRNPPPIRLYH
jgi:hypothetical protein